MNLFSTLLQKLMTTRSRIYEEIKTNETEIVLLLNADKTLHQRNSSRISFQQIIQRQDELTFINVIFCFRFLSLSLSVL